MLNTALTIPNTEENRKKLLELGYEKRSGSCAYQRDFLTVLPFKKFFWEDDKEYSNVKDLKRYIQ